MTTRDLFNTINEQDQSIIDLFVTRLEFRGRDEAFNALRDRYFTRLPWPAARRVLDLGCGTGVVTRAAARQPGFAGTAEGLDQSPALLEAARELAHEEDLGERVQFQAGDAHALPYPDATFDIVIAHTTISHVTEPVTVLRECARVLSAGGTLAIFDGDYASLTFAHPDHALARAMEEGMIASIVAHPRAMRDLPRFLRDAGLAVKESQPGIVANVGGGTFFPNFAETFGPLVARYGLLPQEHVEAWLEDQRAAVTEGRFFAACNYYAYLAQKL